MRTLLLFILSICSLAASPLSKNDHIVFFGDSITQLGQRPGGYVDLINTAVTQQRPHDRITVTGKGISGNKVPDLLRRVERDVLSLEPTKVVIYIGTNDVWHWHKPHPVTKEAREGTSAEDYQAGIQYLITLFKEHKVEPILMTPAVIGEDIKSERVETARLDQYCDIVRALARENQLDLIDLRQEFLSHLQTNNPENKNRGILTADTVHMNANGNLFIAQQLGKLLGLTIEKSSITFQEKPDFDIYLLIGQSNMAGRAQITDDLRDPIKGCYVLNEHAEWAPSNNPLNIYSAIRKDPSWQKLGLGYSFAQTMRKISPHREIGLVVNAKGGSKIESWAKGTEFFKSAVSRTKFAINNGGKLKGILWHQGEANYQAADEHLPKLVQLVTDLRAEFNDDTLPFICGQINPTREDAIPMNEQLIQLPDHLPHTSCVLSKGLTMQDSWHFDTEGQLELGKRYAKEMKALLAQ